MLTRVFAYLFAIIACIIIFGFPAALLCRAVGFLFGYKFWTGILYTLACEVYAYSVARFLVKKLDKIQDRFRGGW